MEKLTFRFPLGLDAHAPYDDVELACQECRYDPGPFGGHEFRPHPHVTGQPPRDIDLEPD
jgi:hypothetical protein